ncbi:MAG TPA: PPC domain-containing DNA-binding protein [Candidatus Dormibacteraeota bacterium]|nr:PPC domain-containing DNA-binding protein [Candidatus Dormibacteraeota bacterium]
MPEARFATVEARSGRVIVGRLLPGADLIGGIEEICDHHNVRFAAVNFAYGSLAEAGFKFLQIPSPGERAVLTPHSLRKRVEFLAGQGLVCEDPDGRRATHLHGAVSDETGSVTGGHFEKGQNPIYNNLDVTLIELLGVRLVRRFEPETQTVEMEVEALSESDAT